MVSLQPCLCFISIYSQWTEEDEIAEYKKNQEWMDECMDGMFEKWYDKIEEESSEDKRKVHLELISCHILKEKYHLNHMIR